MDFLTTFFPNFFLKREIKKYFKSIESGLLDSFLEIILNIMRLIFCVNKKFREDNLSEFNGRYAFKSKDGRIAASAIFANNKMIVKRDEIDNTNVTVIFKDSKTLKGFLFNQNPDIIGSILDNEISYTGNLNYLAKFAYMAKHLQLMFSL